MPTHARPFGSAEDLVAGLCLVATDSGVPIGDGERAPALSLVLATRGHRVTLDDLDGFGLQSLASTRQSWSRAAWWRLSMERREVLIVGGGNAGISLAARLIRKGAPNVTIIDSDPVHRYRPLLSYVGAGEAKMASLERPMRDVIPDGCAWICDSVDGVDAAAATVTTSAGLTLGYSTLVLCPGLVEDWQATPGLREAYADGWAASTFVASAAPQV